MLLVIISVIIYCVIRLFFIDRLEYFIIKNNIFKRILACYGINKNSKRYSKIVEYMYDIVLIWCIILFLIYAIFVYPILFIFINLYISLKIKNNQKQNNTYIKRFNLVLKYPTNIIRLGTGHYDLVSSFKSYDKYLSKIYWNNLFIQNNVSIPEIVAISNYKNITTFNPNYLLNNKEYILKPDKSMGGKGIERFTNIENIPNNDVFIIQEKIKQQSVSHLRVITVKYNSKIEIYQIRYHEQRDPNIITSNTCTSKNGYTSYLIQNTKYVKLNEKIIFQIYI